MTWLIENWPYGILPAITLGIAVGLGWRAEVMQRRSRR